MRLSDLKLLALKGFMYLFIYVDYLWLFVVGFRLVLPLVGQQAPSMDLTTVCSFHYDYCVRFC